MYPLLPGSSEQMHGRTISPIKTCCLTGALWLAASLSLPAHADYDETKAYVEHPKVAAHFPDPAIAIASPAFTEDKRDFTSQAEMEKFIADAARGNAVLRVRELARSQEGRSIPLLIFSSPALMQGGELLKNGKPTVLIIGQQHGNESAGGEAALAFAGKLAYGESAKLLERINILIVPRANPDGAAHFVRTLKNGHDLNRDHLTLLTPEARALAKVFTDYQPDVVLDCHEFTAGSRWITKFGGLQPYDGLIQFARVANLPEEQTQVSEQLFHQAIIKSFDENSLRHSWYYTTPQPLADKRIYMGGVVPDTSRNIAGLRNAISFLLETRGMDLGKAHFKRRVFTHLVAIDAIATATADNAAHILDVTRRLRRDISRQAGQGEININGKATPERRVLTLLNPDNGVEMQQEVNAMAASPILPGILRSRPDGYLLPSSQTRAVQHLQALGLSVYHVAAPQAINVQRYRIVSAEKSRKEDVTGSAGAAENIASLSTALDNDTVQVVNGDFLVPLDQPLANLAVAAMEPDSPSSYASNGLINVPFPLTDKAAYLPLYRLMQPIDTQAIMLPLRTAD